jgi:hypothetical protein
MSLAVIFIVGVVVGGYLAWTYAMARVAGVAVPHLSDSEELEVTYVESICSYCFDASATETYGDDPICRECKSEQIRKEHGA